MGEARTIERELAHYLHHNELALALGEAEALGELCSAPSAYWFELQLAAANMGLDEEARQFAQRAGGQHAAGYLDKRSFSPEK